MGRQESSDTYLLTYLPTYLLTVMAGGGYGTAGELGQLTGGQPVLNEKRPLRKTYSLTYLPT